MTEAEIERIAEIVAKKTVEEMLEHIGIDHSAPRETRKDFDFLRSQREMYSDVGRHSLKAFFAAVLIGIAAIVWTSIKTGKTP